MSNKLLLAANDIQSWLITGGTVFLAVVALIMMLVVLNYGRLWLQAFMSGADVSFSSLIGMSLRRVNAGAVVKAQIMANQAGLKIADRRGETTSKLESHYLAGGDIERVVLAIISANRAGIDLDFERATCVDLAGRDVLEAVRTSIFPKVIDCPDPEHSGQSRLSAIAKDGVELLTHVRVTVRTNLDQLIGGATEATIIARVGQGVVSTIGSMDTHEEALAHPDSISKTVLEQGIQSNTAYEIVSIDIATIDVGRNIGAHLQSEQAEADARVARAVAEIRRAEAVASEQENTADIARQTANLVRARAVVPKALADSIRNGKLRARKKPPGK